MPAPFKTEAIVLRSIRYGEADRILHLYSEDRGRLGTIAKGVRRVKSRLGGGGGALAPREPILRPGRGRPLPHTHPHNPRPHTPPPGRRPPPPRAPPAPRPPPRPQGAPRPPRARPPGLRRRPPPARLDRAEPPGLQPAGARARASGRFAGSRGAGTGPDVPAEAPAGGGLLARAGGLRHVRRARAPRRVLRRRRRGRVPRLRGGLVPAGPRGALVPGLGTGAALGGVPGRSRPRPGPGGPGHRGDAGAPRACSS